jgi:hypothetical protein
MSKKPPWLQNWLDRHQHPASFWLHIVGIPIAVAGLILGGVQLVLAFSDPTYWALWYRPVILIAIGYLLQIIGHRIEGNTVGELIPIKKALGLPYTAVAPRYAQNPPDRAKSEA